KLRGEFPSAGLIAVTGAGDAAVRLSQRFESEIGKAQPRRRRRNFVSDIQTQPADRQQGRRWGEAEVNVDATFHPRGFYPVQAPTPSFINRYVNADRLVSDPAGDTRGSCLPIRVAHHQIIQPHGPALRTAESKDCSPGETPDIVLKK